MSINTSPTRLTVLGLGSRTTEFYLFELNRRVRERFGDDASCPLLLINNDFSRINPYLPNNHRQLEKELTSILKHVPNSSHVIVPNITLHQTLENMSLLESRDFYLVSPIDATIDELKSKGVEKISLFGSAYTSRSDWLTTRFNERGITVEIADPALVDCLDTLRKKVYTSQETQTDLAGFETELARTAQDCAVVIACTELSLIYAETKPESVFDMARIQIKAGLNHVGLKLL